MSDALIAAAQAGLAGTPLGSVLGLDGIARSVTGNFWMEDDQADTLASGDVSKFSQVVDWSALEAQDATPVPQPTGYSTRWYVSRLKLGSGQFTNDGAEGNFKPTLLDRVQPYAVYVPTTYKPGQALPLTWILHSLEVNYNQYGALDPQLIQQLCQDRDSICATTEGFGPAGWYYNEAETDFWQVWRSARRRLHPESGPHRDLRLFDGRVGLLQTRLRASRRLRRRAGARWTGGVRGRGLSGSERAGLQRSDLLAGRPEPAVRGQRPLDPLRDRPDLRRRTGAHHRRDRPGPGLRQPDQRYNLFIHTGGDHLVYATEDKFSDAVAALGKPVRTVNPGASASTGIRASTAARWESAPPATTGSAASAHVTTLPVNSRPHRPRCRAGGSER